LFNAPLHAQQGSVLTYLPDVSQLDGWEPLGDPQTAEGNDLFLLINGGAEIYNEYGFSRAVMHSYDKGEKSVNLEVYEMEDVASAYGAYSFKTSRDGESVPIGTEGNFEDYYLNFWKGNTVVTLVGFDTDPETRDAILALAKMVDANIPDHSPRPAIVDMMPESSPTGVSVHPTYIEGNLGLINRYRFGTADVFGFTNAVVGDYREYLLFAFPYGDSGEAQSRLVNASQLLRSSDSYSDVGSAAHEFTGVDRDGRRVTVRVAGEFLIAYVGEDSEYASSVLKSLSERAEQYSWR